MYIKTLSEDTSISDQFENEHGLSLYIEMQHQKILFDVGASKVFFQNAQKMGVDIADIDLLVISHGHYDHGGGLETFFGQNKKAAVYIHNLAFEKYYATRPNNEIGFIGLAQDLKNNKQIIPTSDRFFIDKGIQVFSNVNACEPTSNANKRLFMEKNGEMVSDTFAHEQNLVLTENGKTLLITGCAHNGIINILNHFYMLKNRMPDYVIGGFHLSDRFEDNEDLTFLDELGNRLLDTKAKYYTCHCTGERAFNHLKTIMGDNIFYIKAGSEIEI